MNEPSDERGNPVDRKAGASLQVDEHMKVILDTIPHGIQENGTDGVITFSNTAHHQMLRYEPGTIVGKKIWDLVADDEEREGLKKYLAYLVKEKPAPVSYFTRSLRQDNTFVDTRVDWNYRIDDEGRVVGFTSIITDISEQKAIEERLRQSEIKFRSIVESAPMGIHRYRCDGSGRLVFIGANPAADAILGIDNRQFIGKTIEEAFPPLADTEVPERYRRACSHGESWQTEQIDYDDRKIRGAFEVHAFPTSPGEMTALFLNITERKRAEEKLKESEEKFRAIYESAMDGILLADTETKMFVSGNGRILDLLGYSAGEIGGLSVHDIHPVEELPHVLEQFEEQRQGNLTVAEDVAVKRKDGSVFYADISSSSVTFEGREYLVGIFRDITERRRAEQEKAEMQARLRQAQKMEVMGTLAGGVAHDFNNILGGIMGYTELAILRKTDSSAVMECLDQIGLAVERARDLVQQILAFSRPQQHSLKLVDITEVTREALKLIDISVPSSVIVHCEIDDDCGFVVGDPVQVQQVLMNLCSNALQAVGEKGRIEVRLGVVRDPPATTSGESAAGEWARLSVRDNGTGMDEETIAHIFEHFFTTKEAGQGTGVGLAVVHQIVKAHGGTITVESEPGKGSLFSVFLPLTERSADSLEKVDDSLPTGSEHLLYIDDEETLLTVGKQLLESLGYRVTVFRDSDEALQAFKHSPDDFDLVITDQTMPAIPGADLAREMLRLRPELPIILCTGHSSVISEEEATEIGVREFLLKPVSRAVFARVIRQALDDSSHPSPGEA